MATEKELRNKLVSYAQGYLGIVQGSPKHKQIIDIFNSIKPYPDGWAMTYTAAWCAAFATACAHACGFDSIIPLSANCGTLLTRAKAMGCWVENDAYVPTAGDLILYDWSDSGIGDNAGAPDHVGIIVSVDKNIIKVIEGNFSTKHTCAYRLINTNGRYIRGYIVPKYSKLASSGNSKPASSGGAVNSEVAISKMYKPIDKRGANVRVQPKVGTTIVGGIPYNTAFKATKQSGDWVYNPDRKGWVCIRQGNNTFLSEVAEQAYRQKWQVVSKIGCNIRTGAGTNYKKVGAVPYGKTFIATDKSGNWVKAPSLGGWICISGSTGTWLKQV